MFRKNLELWLSILAIIIITGIYIFITILFQEIPPSRELFGHLIGVFGFIMMLMTEILYSIRKRNRNARWGRMSSWLQFHIFTGIVGPYLVLLHTAWKFNGLAGFSLFLTILIVVSGFIGRYIYTAIPRNSEGVELDATQIQAEIDEIQAVLNEKMDKLSDPEKQKHTKQLAGLINRQKILNRQKTSLASARKYMGLWHTIHIPIGLVLFTTALFHTFAAFYYATLLK